MLHTALYSGGVHVTGIAGDPIPQSGNSLLCLSHFNTTTTTMAAAIKAINAKIRSNKVLDYVCSTRMSLSRQFPSPNPQPGL
jgi:hypothetical protein